MKKHIAILLIIVTMFSLAACQKTPDEVVVVKKGHGTAGRTGA